MKNNEEKQSKKEWISPIVTDLDIISETFDGGDPGDDGSDSGPSG